MDIEFVRGDTQPIKFQIVDNENRVLKMEENEEIIFTMKKNYNTKSTMLQKKLSDKSIKYDNGYYYMVFEHEDTANLKYGAYVYDIQIMSESMVITAMLGTITLTQEVTHIENE